MVCVWLLGTQGHRRGCQYSGGPPAPPPDLDRLDDRLLGSLGRELDRIWRRPNSTRLVRRRSTTKRNPMNRWSWYLAFLIPSSAFILLALAVSGAVAQASGPPEAVSAPEISWPELLQGADAICEVWVAGVQETKESLGTTMIPLNAPMTSTLVTRESLRGECPKRFVLSWSFPATPELGRYSEEVVLFLRQAGDGSPSGWELFKGALGSWPVESRRAGYRIAGESLEFISPEALQRVTDLPPALFSYQNLTFRFGGQHILDLRSQVVPVSSLERWFADHPEGSVGSTGSQ